MNRCVFTSYSFELMSRPIEARYAPSTEKAVPTDQSSWAMLKNTCAPVVESNPRTTLSEQPTAISFPSGDQLAP